MRIYVNMLIISILLSLLVSGFDNEISYIGLHVQNQTTGNNLNGTYEITTRIYDQVSGGTLLHTDTQNVTIYSGDFGITITYAQTFMNNTFYLEPEIGGETQTRFKYTPAAQSIYTNSSFNAMRINGYLYTEIPISGEVTGTLGNTVIDNNALDDQYYDSESDLTGLLDNNYIAIGAKLGNSSEEIQAAEIDADHDTCAEITGCVENAITDGNTGWDNSYGFYNAEANLTGLLDNNYYNIANPAGYFNSILNFTGTLTDTKICTYSSGTGKISCDYTDLVGEGSASDSNISVTKINVYGTTTKTIEIEQKTQDGINLTNITASFTDIDTDTNANTICTGGTTYLDGEGNCDDISAVYYDSESDLTGLLDNNYIAIGAKLGNSSEEIQAAEIDADHDTCAEITGCVENAITDGNTGWDNSYGFYNTEANLTGLLFDDYVDAVNDTMTGNLTMEALHLENDALHYIKNNATCIIISGDTAKINIC